MTVNVVSGQNRANNRRPEELDVDARGAALVHLARDKAGRVPLTALASLPAAGAYEPDPLLGAMVPIPANATRATIFLSYARGASGGQAEHRVFVADGVKIAQVMAPDGSYAGVAGRASTSSSAVGYAIRVDLDGGETHIGVASAEIGVKGSPGSYESEVTFG